jgi:hypothetical protein
MWRRSPFANDDKIRTTSTLLSVSERAPSSPRSSVASPESDVSMLTTTPLTVHCFGYRAVAVSVRAGGP